MVRPVHCLLDAGAVVSSIQSSVLPANWACHVKKDELPTLRTAQKRPLPTDGLVSLNLQIGDLESRV